MNYYIERLIWTRNVIKEIRHETVWDRGPRRAYITTYGIIWIETYKKYLAPKDGEL